MLDEVPSRVPSVTKTIRKVSPGLSPAGVLMTRSAAAPPPAPNTSQSIAVASANRPVLVNIVDLLYVGSFGRSVQHRTSVCSYRPPPNVGQPAGTQPGARMHEVNVSEEFLSSSSRSHPESGGWPG